MSKLKIEVIPKDKISYPYIGVCKEEPVYVYFEGKDEGFHLTGGSDLEFLLFGIGARSGFDAWQWL